MALFSLELTGFVLCLLENISDGRKQNSLLSAYMNQNLNDLCFFLNIVFGCVLKRPLHDLFSREELVI